MDMDGAVSGKEEERPREVREETEGGREVHE